MNSNNSDRSLLEIKQVTKRFDGLLAVDDFSAVIYPRRIVALIGPNGAGKTTIFNIITGFLPFDKGHVLFKDQKINETEPYKIHRKGIARTFQNLRLIHKLSVVDNVLLSRPKQSGENIIPAIFNMKKILSEEQKNQEKALEILEYVELIEKQHEMASDLSYGQQKLLTIACCLATEAELFLLDEPVSGIDPKIRKKILKLMQSLIKREKTILFIEHNFEAVQEVSDHVIVMHNGRKIEEGDPDIIFHKQGLIEAYLQ